jgi:carbamoyl-phosphate synthase large subunit
VIKINSDKIKILITSVGSLVGQNILDVLDFNEFNRRSYIEVSGTNSEEKNINNFRCDKCFLVPLTYSTLYNDKIIEILEEVNPDIILCGRDIDTIVIKKILNENPNLTARLPYGSLKSLQLAYNKWETFQFALKYNLPFAETIVFQNSADLIKLHQFVKISHFPLIAKPIMGSASKGVFFIRNFSQLEKFSNYSQYLFQEYLGNAVDLEDYFEFMDGLIPLFAQVPNISHHSCNVFINKDGSTDQVFVSLNEHNCGVTMGFQKVENRELENITLKFAKALYKEGGTGPLTVQFRQDINGNWKAQEINMRTNGNTFPRFLLGQDDLSLIINDLMPDKYFPKYIPNNEINDIIINKTLNVDFIYPKEIEQFRKSGFYKKQN